MIHMVKEIQIRDILTSTDFLGKIVATSVNLETSIDALLCRYFIREDRDYDAINILFGSITMGRKIETLRKLPTRKSLLSYKRTIEGVRGFQRLRNLVAHNTFIPKSEIKKLRKDSFTKKLLSNYPQSYYDAQVETTDAIKRLIRTKEFQRGDVKNSETLISVHLMKLFDV